MGVGRFALSNLSDCGRVNNTNGIALHYKLYQTLKSARPFQASTTKAFIMGKFAI